MSNAPRTRKLIKRWAEATKGIYRDVFGEMERIEIDLYAALEVSAKHAEDAKKLELKVQALERDVVALKKRIADVTDL